MTAIPWWCYVLAGASIATGLAGLALVICSGRVSRAEATDPYRLAGRAGDGPTFDLARALDVDVTPDGSHDNLSDVDDARWAAELLWLHELWPDSVLLDEPPPDDPWCEVTIVPGRDLTQGEHNNP